MAIRLLDYFREHASGIRHVLIDVFDTLVLRTVEPEHVKRIVARRLRDFYGTALSAGEIYAVRSRLERLLCEENAGRNGDLEFRLSDMLSQLRLDLQQRDWAAFRRVDEHEFIRIGTRIEAETERFVQRPDTHVVEFLREVHRRNVPVTVVTDTYLPKQIIEELLEFHGILPYLRGVVVSNDYLETKRSGRLYDRILADVGAPAESVLMVGDNQYSDIERAASRGIATYHLDRGQAHRQYEEFKRTHADQHRIEAELAGCLAADAAFREMACSLYAFTARLHARLVNQGARDVFFLSREGEYLRELFDLYQTINGYGPDSLLHVRSHYLLVSRKSTFVPSLSAIGNESFQTLFRQYRRLTLFEFLHSLNFPDEDIGTIARGIGADARQVEEDFPTSSTFIRLKNSEAFRSRYEMIRTGQRDNFLRYVDGFGVKRDDRLHIVDIGWKGTIQDHLFKIFDGQQGICGYYLGLVDYGNASPLNQKEAILFDTIRPVGRYDLIYNCNRAIFEVFAEASHGSARCYNCSGDAVTVITDDNEAEIHLYRTAIRPLQDRLREMFERIARLLSVSGFETDRFGRCFARKHFRLVYRPCRQELQFFRNLYHFENFGFLAKSTFDSDRRPSLLQRLRNVREFLRDPSASLARGWWTPLTLDNLGLGLLSRPYGRWMERRYFHQAGGPEQEIKRHHEAMIVELKDGIARQSRMISERDNYIKQVEKLAVERYEVMERQSALIADRDALITDLRAQIEGTFDGAGRSERVGSES